jgi:hypothetical protein
MVISGPARQHERQTGGRTLVSHSDGGRTGSHGTVFCLEADRAMTGMNVAQAPQRAEAERVSLPASIAVDSGSEFCSRALKRG